MPNGHHSCRLISLRCSISEAWDLHEESIARALILVHACTTRTWVQSLLLACDGGMFATHLGEALKRVVSHIQLYEFHQRGERWREGLHLVAAGRGGGRKRKGVEQVKGATGGEKGKGRRGRYGGGERGREGEREGVEREREGGSREREGIERKKERERESERERRQRERKQAEGGVKERVGESATVDKSGTPFNEHEHIRYSTIQYCFHSSVWSPAGSARVYL